LQHENITLSTLDRNEENKSSISGWLDTVCGKLSRTNYFPKKFCNCCITALQMAALFCTPSGLIRH